MKDFSSFTSIINIRIRGDQYQKIKESKMNISKFIREKLDEEFETQESLEEEENELLSELEIIKKKKEIIKIKNPKKEDLPILEKEFLKETKEILKKDIGFLSGRWNLYKNKFGKTISLNKFRELIE